MRKRIIVLIAFCSFIQLALPVAPAVADPKTFVLWSPRGIPGSAQRHLENVAGVNDATSVVLTTDWLMRSWMPGGDKVDQLPSGYGYPMEVIAVHPGPFSHFVPAPFQDAFRTMKRTEAIISAREERIRGEGVGLKLGFRSGRRDVSAVVSQVATGGYEAILATRPREWSHRVRFFLVRGSNAVKKKRLRKAVINAAGNIPLEIRSGKDNLLRYAPFDQAHRQLQVTLRRVPRAAFVQRRVQHPSRLGREPHPHRVGSHPRQRQVPQETVPGAPRGASRTPRQRARVSDPSRRVRRLLQPALHGPAPRNASIASQLGHRRRCEHRGQRARPGTSSGPSPREDHAHMGLRMGWRLANPGRDALRMGPLPGLIRKTL